MSAAGRGVVAVTVTQKTGNRPTFTASTGQCTSLPGRLPDLQCDSGLQIAGKIMIATPTPHRTGVDYRACR
jgi:hypothetical protein